MNGRMKVQHKCRLQPFCIRKIAMNGNRKAWSELLPVYKKGVFFLLKKKVNCYIVICGVRKYTTYFVIAVSLTSLFSVLMYIWIFHKIRDIGRNEAVIILHFIMPRAERRKHGKD